MLQFDSLLMTKLFYIVLVLLNILLALNVQVLFCAFSLFCCLTWKKLSYWFLTIQWHVLMCNCNLLWLFMFKRIRIPVKSSNHLGVCYILYSWDRVIRVAICVSVTFIEFFSALSDYEALREQCHLGSDFDVSSGE